MPPMFGYPNYDFLQENPHSENDQKVEGNVTYFGLTEMAFWYTVVLVAMLFLWLLMFFCLRIISLRQKTRNPQQRRQYIGTRTRPPLPQVEPTIYVSPANLPPPPKYEAMAPPSYEEVVGIHYPNYHPTQIQPIAHPISTAMVQITNASVATNIPESRNPDTPSGGTPTTVLSVTNERRTVVTSSS